MSDMPEWERKYWIQKQKQMQQGKSNNSNSYTKMPSDPSQLPHYEPAHIAHRQQPGQSNDGWRDINPTGAMFANIDAMAARGMGPQTKTVMIKPGATYYKPVQAESFGSTMPLVIKCGQYAEKTMREFELKNVCRCYVIDNNMQAVDLGNPDPNKMINLVELRAPFVGVMLVEESAVISGGGSSNGPQVLKG